MKMGNTERGPWGRFNYAYEINSRSQTEILARIRQVEAASLAPEN
jgi:hypothetical protein